MKGPSSPESSDKSDEQEQELQEKQPGRGAPQQHIWGGAVTFSKQKQLLLISAA